MEKEILEILKSMQEQMNRLETKVNDLEKVQIRIENKLDGVVEQTADLTEFRTEINNKLEDLKEVKEVTKENCYEIAKIKAVK